MSEVARLNRREAIQAFKRQGILDAAEALFLEVGLEGATVRAIAKRAGCALGTVYLHFKTKEDIYAALLGGSLDRLTVWIDEKVAAAEAGASAQEALGSFYLYYALHPRELDLGLYLFQGTQRRGLSKELDAQLNAQLAQGLSRLAIYLAKLKGLTMESAKEAVLDLISHMVGCLILENTGRLSAMGGKGDEIIQRHIVGLIER